MQHVPPSQDHLTTADVRNIIALKHAFPTSFDTTGNMPGKYTICVDPSLPPSTACIQEDTNKSQRGN